MEIKKILLRSAVIILAAAVSVPLALMSEGFSLQHRIIDGTPGLYVAGRLFPASTDRGFEVMSKQMPIELTVDAGVWFLLLCGGALLIARWRKKTRPT